MNPEAPIPTAAKLKKFCTANGIAKLAVFGSALREVFGPESDVDLLVKFTPEVRKSLSLLGHEQLQHDISPLFGGRRIDLFEAESLPDYSCDRIIAEAVLLYPRRQPPKQPPLAVDEDTPLRLMRDRARRAVEMTAGRTRQDLEDDWMLFHALCYTVEHLSPQRKRISAATRRELSEIDFDGLSNLRRYLIEQFNAVDLDRLWAAATRTCPTIVSRLDAFLPPEEERPGAYRGEPLDW